MALIKVPELARRTGATQRQIRYWVEIGLITPSQYRGGSGFYILFDEEIIPKIEFLTNISAILRDKELFQKINDRYDKGHVFLGEGFVLAWFLEET